MRQPTVPARHRQPVRRPQTRTPRRKKSRFGRFLFYMLAILLIYLYLDESQMLERPLPEIINIEPPPPVTGLHPVVEQKKQELIARTEEIGIEILITDGHRSEEEQNALYRQGRSEEGQIVTNVQGGGSYHNYGLAIDFALRTPDGRVLWDLEYDGNGNGQSDWMEVVAIAKELGFTWGGDWQGFKDYPHLQMDFGYSIAELKRGKRPPDTPE
ncbi:M15 family metallopeptidase [Paenibacillus daejeonensis]|uniref:M15 family metallopeptidase n=1 Tax=Paenibacillus daejeonensis TaxID=135193 RepID=UPI003CCC239F